MQQIIIDSDFYTNPTQMKDLFTNLDFAKNDNMLQGQICPMQFANADMLSYIHSVLGAPNDQIFDYVPGSGTFIINQENELPARSICIQYPELDTQWVGVVSLNQTPESHYLKFYKHNRTGWSGIPTDPEELSKEKLYSYEHIETFMEFENHNWEEKWTETSRIELKYNQLTLFRPWLFHSYNDVFGNSKETGRLLQFFFLKPKPPQDLTAQE